MANEDRTILHCDCNSFFASVELLDYPEYRDKPFAVCGNPENRHGIILAKNEAAKRYGVNTAETIWQAKKKCPDLMLVPPHHERYAHYSGLINKIYERFTSQVEPFGIDESWLDVTGSLHLFGDGKKIADTIRETLKNELKLTASVGVSFNKVFAKLGSDYKKPDATTVVSRENYREIIYPLPVKDLLYVGKAAADALAKQNIFTIGQLAEADKKAIMLLLGKAGEVIHNYANGKDLSTVASVGEKEEIKSLGNSITFKRDLVTLSDIKAGVNALADSVATRLRYHGYKCRTLQVGIKDTQFKTISRQRKLDKPTCLKKEISETALEIIMDGWNIKTPIRMLNITGMQLVHENEAAEQISLFDPFGYKKRERQEKLEYTIDRLRAKYGKSSILMGVFTRGKDLGIYKDTDKDEDEEK